MNKVRPDNLSLIIILDLLASKTLKTQIMKYLNYGLVNISISDLIEKAMSISGQMRENPYFKRPYPSLDEIDSLTEDLYAVNEKVENGASNQIPIMQEKFVCLKRKLKQLGTFVAIKSQGNPLVVKTSGFEVSDQPEDIQD